jgi:hypothetical protein
VGGNISLAWDQSRAHPTSLNFLTISLYLSNLPRRAKRSCKVTSSPPQSLPRQNVKPEAPVESKITIGVPRPPSTHLSSLSLTISFGRSDADGGYDIPTVRRAEVLSVLRWGRISCASCNDVLFCSPMPSTRTELRYHPRAASGSDM